MSFKSPYEVYATLKGADKNEEQVKTIKNTKDYIDKRIDFLKNVNLDNNEYNKLKEELCSNLFKTNYSCYDDDGSNNPYYKLYVNLRYLSYDSNDTEKNNSKKYYDEKSASIKKEIEKFIKNFKPHYTECIFETYKIDFLKTLPNDKNDTLNDISIFDDKNIMSSRIQNNLEIFKNSINNFYDKIINAQNFCKDLFKEIFPNKQDFLESILKYVFEKYPANTGGSRNRTRKIQRGCGKRRRKKTHCRGRRGRKRRSTNKK
jgi:hypothetical protein